MKVHLGTFYFEGTFMYILVQVHTMRLAAKSAQGLSILLLLQTETWGDRVSYINTMDELLCIRKTRTMLLKTVTIIRFWCLIIDGAPDPSFDSLLTYFWHWSVKNKSGLVIIWNVLDQKHPECLVERKQIKSHTCFG